MRERVGRLPVGLGFGPCRCVGCELELQNGGSHIVERSRFWKCAGSRRIESRFDLSDGRQGAHQDYKHPAYHA